MRRQRQEGRSGKLASSIARRSDQPAKAWSMTHLRKVGNLHRCGTWLRDGFNPCRLLEDQEHAFQISRPDPPRFPLRFRAN